MNVIRVLVTMVVFGLMIAHYFEWDLSIRGLTKDPVKEIWVEQGEPVG